MELLSVKIAEILGVILFFIVSTFSMQFFVRTPWEQVKNKHWTIKMVWWYGIAFAIFLISAVWISLVVWLAQRIG